MSCAFRIFAIAVWIVPHRQNILPDLIHVVLVRACCDRRDVLAMRISGELLLLRDRVVMMYTTRSWRRVSHTWQSLFRAPHLFSPLQTSTTYATSSQFACDAFTRRWTPVILVYMVLVCTLQGRCLALISWRRTQRPVPTSTCRRILKVWCSCGKYPEHLDISIERRSHAMADTGT